MNRSSSSNSNRASGSFDVKAHNFGLFSLVKVLSVSSGSKAKPKGKIDANSLNNKQDVTIDVVAQGGYIGHEFLALYCSNDHFIFRHVGESGVPLVRRLPWLKDPAKKITAMAFNPTAQWLLCVTHDRNIVLIPIYFIMFKSQEANSMMSFNDIKMFSASSKSNAQRHFNHCVWWRPYNSSEDYGIFGSETGSIRIVNLATKERLRLKMKYPISKVEIIEDTTKTSKYLLLNTVGGGYWKLILEQNIGGTSYQSIIKQFNKPPFVLTQINKFGTETALSLQRMHQSEQVIGAYDRSNNKIEIYDALLTKFPLFVFQLFDSEIKDVYLTDKVIFTLRTDEDGWKLGVISRLLSGASANPRWMSKYQKESKLQEFKFGLNERIAGHLPAFVAPKTHVPNSQPSPSLSSPTASMGDQLEFTIIDQTIREQQAAAKSSNGDSMTSEPLEGMFIYTRDSVYEVRPRTPPEQIFFELVQQRSASAEALGKTFALDLLALYEAAADSHIHRGDYGRALDLYYLSNVQTSKLVAKFLEVGRMDVIITRLRSTLGEPTALSMTERRRLSNTLLQCYLQKLLQSKEFQYLDEEFQKFLRKNEDYDANKALALFLEHGLMRYFLLVGDARNLMPRAMQLLATERGSLNIGPEEIKYLTENFLLEHLKSGANGALAKSLPASEQIQLYLADPITVHKYFSRIYSLLPYLTEEVLIQIASYFDPLGENMMKVFSFATSKTAKIMELEVQGGSLNNSSAAVNTNSLNNSSYLSKETVEEEHAATKEEYVELFLSTLFVLNYRRQQRSEPQAKKAKSVQYQMVQSFNEKKVSKVTCGWSHTAVITEDGQVYIWGRNNFSQLGLGHSDHKFTPQKLSSLSHVNITHIACGGEHTIAVDESGTVYAWGANDHGQLGLGDTESRSVPTAITELGQVRVKSLACGWSHSLILTDKGLWVFGAGSQGQLGLGDRDDKHAPHLIAFLEGSKIAQWKAVSCGFHHNALLLDNGNVYTWGSGLYGQLGHGDSEDLLIPRLLSALVGTHFTSVACGSFHTVAVNDLGNIYLWGRAMKKSKVEQERYEDQLEPKLIEFLMGKQASLIATGHFHTVVVSAQGKVYMWGKSFSANKAQKTNDRQRSIAEMFSEVPTPILALKGKRIKQICCGDEFNVVLTERGHVYTWGSGRFGQLGHNSLNDEWAPRLVDSLNEVVNYRVFGNESNTNDKQKNGTEANGAEANGTQKKHLAFDHDEELYGPAMIEATLRGWDAPQVPAGTLNSSNALSASTGPGQHATVPYRPHLVLDKALEWNNFSAASIVALQTRRWLLAVYCTLKSYETMFQTNDEDRTDETLSVLGLLNFIVKDLANVPNREELLYQILQFWHDRKLPLAPLEEHIKDNIRVLAPLLGELLLLQEIPAGSDKSPLCVTLSQDIYFAVVTSYTQLMDENFRKEQSEKVPEEKLLASIRNNLNKDVDVKDKIALSTMLAPIKGPTNVNPEDPTHVAFTCGHYFARDDYQDRILPQFKSRAEQLPIAVPVTTKLLLGEYQQRVMNVACPVCVFNYLRVQQTQIDTRAQVEKWEI